MNGRAELPPPSSLFFFFFRLISCFVLYIFFLSLNWAQLRLLLFLYFINKLRRFKKKKNYLNYALTHAVISPTSSVFPSPLQPSSAESHVTVIKALIQRRRVGGYLLFTWCCHGESRYWSSTDDGFIVVVTRGQHTQSWLNQLWTPVLKPEIQSSLSQSLLILSFFGFFCFVDF